MKSKIISIIIFPLLLESASLSHNEIAKMVSKIKDERGGINLDKLNSTPNPFDIYIPPQVEEVVKEIKKVEKPKTEFKPKPIIIYTITAILNNKAFINKKWYGVGDKIGEFKVISIGKDYAILRSKEETKKLVIHSRKKKIKLFKGN
jgi:chorismate mutase